MDIQNLRWWGWGTLDKSFDLEGRTAFWPGLERMLELPGDRKPRPPVSLEEIELRPTRLDDRMLTWLRKLLGDEAIFTDRRTRVEHAYGKSYCDLIRLRAGYIPHPPDAVVYPTNEDEIAALLAWAADQDIAIIPFGGGSSVLGGVEPPPEDRRCITLDLAKLDRVLSVDPVSRTARIQAGATGPEVEAQLNAQGFTLGHFPQSFEFSTLGGWIVTRSAGQNSIGYGKIEDMTQAVRVITPAGVLETRDTPATAVGPSILGLVMGSEGTYGVLTEATMRLHPLPEVRDYRGLLFRTFEDGLAAFRDLMQSNLHPSIVRLSDPPETAAYALMSHQHHGLRALFDKALERYLRLRGYGLDEGLALSEANVCLMILGFDGRLDDVEARWNRALEVCRDHRGLHLGHRPGRSWQRDRFAQPYLRDDLLDNGVLVDTLETATTWSNLTRVYEAMTAALKSAIADTDGGPGAVLTHVSHAYPHGASLYSTFLGRQTSHAPLENQEQWRIIKHQTTEAILAAGGTLSHHHGVGRDHAPWLEEEIGPLAMEALRAFKDTFDPAGIMNPGVLFTVKRQT